MGKFSKNNQIGKAWEISSHTFSIVWVLFYIRFPSCGISHHMRNAWVSLTISHSTGKCNKTFGKPGKSVLILFPQCSCICPITFPSCNILHYMGNAQVSPSIFHSTGKCSEIHRIERAWEIGTHTFPQSMGTFFRQIPIVFYLLPHGKWMAFPINFPQHQFQTLWN